MAYAAYYIKEVIEALRSKKQNFFGKILLTNLKNLL